MRFIMALLTAIVAVGNAAAQANDALNGAMVNALAIARQSLEQADGLENIERIGVARIQGAGQDVTALVQSVLTKSEFDVVLTDDADWAPLLDEFARQVKREDIILKETAHELRVQGVDAVVFGTVEKADVEALDEPGRQGERATARLLLNMASVREENPGSLIWSEQVTGTAVSAVPKNFEDQAMGFFVRYRLALIATGVVLALVLAWMVFRQATRPR